MNGRLLAFEPARKMFRFRLSDKPIDANTAKKPNSGEFSTLLNLSSADHSSDAHLYQVRLPQKCIRKRGQTPYLGNWRQPVRHEGV